MRKKVLAIVLVFIMLFSVFTLTGCFGDNSALIKELTKKIEKLEEELSNAPNTDYIKDLQDKINKLKEEGSSNADYIKDLQDKINILKEELSNVPNADYIKDLQDKINKLKEEGSANADFIKDLQDKINKLKEEGSSNAHYIKDLQDKINKLKEEGSANADFIKDLQDQLDNITLAITTSYDYNPDQEITVRFNGIDYYRFKLTRELHNSYNPDDICMTSHIHFCGYLTFTNLYYHEIKISTIERLFSIKKADSAGINGLLFRYMSSQLAEVIKKNETKTMPFNINYSGTNFMKKTIFAMEAYAIVNDNIYANDYTIPLAVIPNFYTMTGDLESIPSR